MYWRTIMDAATVKALLLNHLPDCEFHVQGEGSNYDITAVGEVFQDLSLENPPVCLAEPFRGEIQEREIGPIRFETRLDRSCLLESP